MSNANRPNRKASDEDIIKLNSVGLSLGTIAKQLGTHPTTITLRLRSLGIPPADTRRTFMEDVYTALSSDQQDWLAEQLGPHVSIKDYVKSLLVKEYLIKTP
jgi:IS30 family transposase